MKTHMQRWLARVALSLIGIAAWGNGAAAQSLSGVYGGEQCPYRLTFRGKDVVYIQFLAGGKVMRELPGQYKVDGDKVSVTAPLEGWVFTQKGNALETPAMGRTTVCTKLSDVALAQIACDQFRLDLQHRQHVLRHPPHPSHPDPRRGQIRGHLR